MIKIWTLAIVVTFFAVAPVRASDTTFSLVGESTKVCQLNGETDWLTGKPTAAQTLTNFGMYAADLGTPVDTGGSKLYFLFGDTWPTFPPPAIGVATPNDSVGTSTLTTTPTGKTCLDLKSRLLGAAAANVRPSDRDARNRSGIFQRAVGRRLCPPVTVRIFLDQSLRPADPTSPVAHRPAYAGPKHIGLS
jgi:hypothetical protein